MSEIPKRGIPPIENLGAGLLLMLTESSSLALLSQWLIPKILGGSAFLTESMDLAMKIVLAENVLAAGCLGLHRLWNKFLKK